MLRGALTGRPAGSWTDDTDMAVCVARAAAQGLALTEPEGLDAVAAGFHQWYSDGPPDIGNQTHAVLSSAPPNRAMGDVAAKYLTGHRNAAGNGSLMRTGPVALPHLGHDDQIAAAARAVSGLTHAHDLAGDACVLWSIAIDRAVLEGRLDGVRDGIDLLPDERCSYWARVLNDAETIPLGDLRSNGFVVTALQAAWRAIVDTKDAPSGSEHLQSALRAAVAIGGDTDTVADIAGGLLGARYGAAAVPFPWRRRLAGWPPGFGHADLVHLGILAARRGMRDNVGWPIVEDLMPYYQRRHHPNGLAVELPDHPGVLWGDVGALPSVEASAFVSLCRIGRGQRRGPEHHEVWLMDDSTNADLPFVLADTADAVEALRREMRTVFVHCVRAESRTPSVAITWLMRHRGLTVDAALDTVRQALPGSNPNPSMLAALRSI